MKILLHINAIQNISDLVSQDLRIHLQKNNS